MIRSARAAAALALLFLCAAAPLGGDGASGGEGALRLHPARAAYLLGCGGCHGENGRSNPAVVPDLAGQVGFFLCTSEGRDYLIRLPNVAFANMSSEKLAELVNFMVFDLGGASVPAKSRPYDAAEIDRLRRAPFRMTDFLANRAKVLDGVVRACPAAAKYPAFAPDDPYVLANRH